LLSLLTSMLSLGLVVLLALVSVNYVQGLLSRSAVTKAAVLIIAQGTQIAGAAQVHAGTYGATGATVQDLVNAKLLRSVPAPPFSDGGQYTFTSARELRLAITSERLCGELQNRLYSNPAISASKPARHGCYNSDGAYVFLMR
jgi:hypothetical protein